MLPQSFRVRPLAWTLASCVAAGVWASSAVGCSAEPDSQVSVSPTQRDAGPVSAGHAGNSDGIALCSGCPSDVRAADDDRVRVHHVHLNVRDAEQATAFYGEHFGTQRVRLNDRADALWADPLLLLLDEGDVAFSDELRFGFEHIGLGVDDVAAWFAKAVAKGVSTVAWYQQLLGVAPLLSMVDPRAPLPTNGIALDGVQLNFLAPTAPFEPIGTDGQPLDHIAFSVPDLDAAFEHARTIGAEIVSEPTETEHGFRSFFVRGPQLALLELVAAGPVRLP
jgi:catechol 2,3-dioxygenase-like lactoylglutathione lyase family enzyme